MRIEIRRIAREGREKKNQSQDGIKREKQEVRRAAPARAEEQASRVSAQIKEKHK